MTVGLGSREDGGKSTSEPRMTIDNTLAIRDLSSLDLWGLGS